VKVHFNPSSILITICSLSSLFLIKKVLKRATINFKKGAEEGCTLTLDLSSVCECVCVRVRVCVCEREKEM